jgi:pimeloyl-ACP methyl ester carboxylesterase
MHLYESPGAYEYPPVVVLHGIGSSATAYAPLLRQLRESLPHTILAPDAPGHGFSDIPEPLPGPSDFFDAVAEALDRLLDRPAVVIGTSMGGALALRYAASRPDQVAGLFLCSPAGAPMSGPELAALRQVFELPQPEDGVAFVERLFHEPPRGQQLVGRLVRTRLRMPTVRTLLDGVGPADFLTIDEADRLTMPITLLWGRSERLLPPSLLAWYRTHLPTHAIVEEPLGFAHSAHLERTAELADRIRGFVYDLEGGDPAGSLAG